MPVLEAKAAWLTACRASRSQRLPAGPPRIATKPKRSIKRSDSRAAPGGRVSNTAGGNAAANAPNEGLGPLPDRTVPAPQAHVGDPLGAHSWRSRSSPLNTALQTPRRMGGACEFARKGKSAQGGCLDPANRRAGDPREQTSATAESHCWNGLLAAVSTRVTGAGETARTERQQPCPPTPPQLPLRPGDAALWRRRPGGRPPPLATNS